MNDRRLPKLVWSFRDHILVVCPRCSREAHIEAHKRSEEHAGLICVHCGYCPKTLAAGPRQMHTYEGLDPFYGLPLWLRDQVGSRVVWAYNWSHLEDLEFFLTGNWRDHRDMVASSHHPGPHSYRNQLPRWMHLKANKPHILRAIRRIKESRLTCSRS